MYTDEVETLVLHPEDGGVARSPEPRRARASLRVLIIDDNALVRRSIVARLDEEPGMEVVGQAETGEQGVHLARTLLPDAVILDYSLPGIRGPEVARVLKTLTPTPWVVIFSVHAEVEYRLSALRAGADAYVLKEDFETGILPLLRSRLKS